MASDRTTRKRNSDSGNGYIPPVRVRMFRHGLGDCFLITFGDGADRRHMLIDCGTLGNKYTKVRIEQVVDHILQEIGPRGRLDVVVATHEHKDHLSGFNSPAFKQLKGKVGHAWLAWTEDRNDKLAQQLAKTKQDLAAALAAAAQADPDSALCLYLTDLLEFAGDPARGPAAFAETVNQAMDFVQKGLGAESTYHHPGDLIAPDWLPGFRIYVLGPPRDVAALKVVGEHGSEQLYGLRAAALNAARSWKEPASLEEQDLEERERLQYEPFDQQFRWTGEQQKERLYPEYCAEENAWRRIDTDWMSITSGLALQLDSLTNNTSLVLAIERVADGKVLLFPGDAQLGSWQSWHEPRMQWEVDDGTGKPRTINAADLLSRTVFYKVAHHGSHNATASGQGLELMTRQAELTAFIPVDRAVALTRNPPSSWQMPAYPLYRRLLEKCQGRVARSDIGWARKPSPEQESETQFAGMATDQDWTAWQAAQERAAHVREEELYIEYVLR